LRCLPSDSLAFVTSQIMQKLYYTVIRDSGVLMDDNYTVSNCVVCTFIVLHSIMVDYSDIATDPGVLINYRILDDSTLAHTDGRNTFPHIDTYLFRGLIIIRAHHDGIEDLSSRANNASYSDYGILNLTISYDGTIAQNGCLNNAAIYFGAREKSGACVYWSRLIVEIEFGKYMRKGGI